MFTARKMTVGRYVSPGTTNILAGVEFPSIIIRRISDNYGQLHPQSARTGAVLLYHPFGYDQNENNKWLHNITLFKRECLAGVEAE